MTSRPNNIPTSENNKEHIIMNGHSNNFNNLKDNSTDMNKVKNNNSASESSECENNVVPKTILNRLTSNLTTIFINVASFLILIILFVLFKKKHFTPFRRGFFCSDLSIRYPVGEDSISTSTLVAACVVIAIVIFIIGEYILNHKLNISKDAKGSELWSEKWFVKATKFFLIYLWALLASQVIVNVLKHSIGTLRPNFFTVCNPNITCKSDDQTYHTDYSCQGISASKEASLRTSFPSGHAAFSATAALFLVIYIQSKSMKRINISLYAKAKAINAFVVLLCPSLQLLCFILSCWTSLLRVSDYKHHLVDVIVGYVIGGLIGAIASIHALGWDKIAIQQNFADKQNSNGSPCSIQEQVELNEANGHYKNKINKEGDIEKVMEIEGGFHAANVNITRQNTTMTSESEIIVE